MANNGAHYHALNATLLANYGAQEIGRYQSFVRDVKPTIGYRLNNGMFAVVFWANGAGEVSFYDTEKEVRLIVG